MSLWTIIRQARSGFYEAHGDPASADCVLGFAFGAIQENGILRPGATNEDLARFAAERLANLPLILQHELADALPPHSAISVPCRIERHRVAGRYLDTREVAEQAAAAMQGNGWRTAVVLAHAHHVPRADAVCRKLGIETVVPRGLDAVSFCPGSIQPWTRNSRAWFRREVPAIVLYRLKGWI